jgi:hypothetical protein
MNELAHADYLALPEAIRTVYTFEQYLWLSDREKAVLVQAETEPDQYDD